MTDQPEPMKDVKERMADVNARLDAEIEIAASKTTPRKQLQEIKEAEDLFVPARKLPVAIDYFTDAYNPYEMAEKVVYSNGIVTVVMEKGFKWDGASIPVWLPIVPWVLTLLAMHFYPSPWLWIATALLVAYSVRLLPYMQKMGMHARAMAVHDSLYRYQKRITRLQCDAIMESILESDGIPWDVRWLIYRRVRQFGWIAWWLNKREIQRKLKAAMEAEDAK